MNQLPLVHEDVCHAVQQEVDEDNFCTKTARHLIKTNPTIAGFLGTFVSKLPPCCSSAAMIGAFVVYRLLESQAECNKMNEEIKL